MFCCLMLSALKTLDNRSLFPSPYLGFPLSPVQRLFLIHARIFHTFPEGI